MPIRNFTDKQEEEIAKRYLNGESAREIARSFNLSHHISITNALKRQDIKQRSPAERNRLYQVNHYTFDEIDNEEKAYWLGFLYADGSVHKRTLTVALSAKDKKQVEKLKIFLQSEHPIKTTTEKVNEKYYKKAIISVTSKHLTEQLKKLGVITSRPDFNKYIKLLPKHLIPHWIRGYFDGDGCAKKSKTITFVGKPELLEWIRYQMATNTGTNPDLSLYQKNGISELYFGGRKVALKVANFMYKDATIYMERKKNVINNWPLPQKRYRNKKGQFT